MTKRIRLKSLKVECAYKHKYNYRSEAELYFFNGYKLGAILEEYILQVGNKSIVKFEKEMNQYNLAA